MGLNLLALVSPLAIKAAVGGTLHRPDRLGDVAGRLAAEYLMTMPQKGHTPGRLVPGSHILSLPPDSLNNNTSIHLQAYAAWPSRNRNVTCSNYNQIAVAADSTGCQQRHLYDSSLYDVNGQLRNGVLSEERFTTLQALKDDCEQHRMRHLGSPDACTAVTFKLLPNTFKTKQIGTGILLKGVPDHSCAELPDEGRDILWMDLVNVFPVFFVVIAWDTHPDRVQAVLDTWGLPLKQRRIDSMFVVDSLMPELAWAPQFIPPTDEASKQEAKDCPNCMNLKVLSALDQAQKMLKGHHKYVMKVDDDTYVDLMQVYNFVYSIPDPESAHYFGQCIHAPGSQDSHRGCGGKFSCEGLTGKEMYATGGDGYILSRKALALLSETWQTQQCKTHYMEDISVGLCLQKKGIMCETYHNKTQQQTYPSETMVSAHPINPATMRQLYASSRPFAAIGSGRRRA